MAEPVPATAERPHPKPPPTPPAPPGGTEIRPTAPPPPRREGVVSDPDVLSAASH
jgi:hypothetical protein